MSARISVSSIVALALITLTGCGPKGAYKQAEVTTRSLAGTRSELQSTKQAVEYSVACLNDLVNNPKEDMKKQYAAFSKAVDDVNKHYERSRDLALDVRTKREQYLAKWQEESAAISDPDLKARASNRMEEARASFDQMRERLDAVNTTMQPFHSDINDLRRYLGNDLTVAGVKSVSDLIGKVRSEGEAANRSIDAAITEINRVNREIKPAATQPAK